MQRRQFISLVGGAAATWPLGSRGQQLAMPVVGYFWPGQEETILAPAFRKGLSELGFIEGRNVAIEYRLGRNDLSRTPELVADLVRRKVAVIAATGGTPGALAAKEATSTIPIVFETGGDPVEVGLVASFNRPGGNVTGIAALNRVLDGKRLALLAELVPAAMRIGVLWPDFTSPPSQARLRVLTTTIAAELGRQIETLLATDGRQIDAVFASLAEKRIDALYLPPHPIFFSLRTQIVTTGARYAIPVVYGDRQIVEAGGLMSYGVDAADDWRLVGTYVGRILKGEKPADLPVLQPTKFDFILNMQTARLLRIVVPPDAVDIVHAIDAFAADPNGGLLVLPPPSPTAVRETIYRLSAQHRLPVIYTNRADAAAGGLLAYATDLVDQYRRAAAYVDRILRGAKVSELPVQFPTKYQLVVNLKTAKTLGLAIPATLIARADEVIE